MTRKRNKKQHLQKALNEHDDLKAADMRELMKLNYKIRCKYRNKKQKDMAELIMNNRIVFVSGPPGTGKTLIALKTGLEIIKNQNISIDKMVLTTPIVNVGKDVGFLPGDLTDKTGKYFSHFYSNIDKIVGKEITSFLSSSGIVSQKIVNFMRGDTFGRYDENGAPIGEYCILDEGQNMSAHQIKTYISRLGENTKIVILYDPDQSDVNWKNGEINGCEDAVNRLKGLDGIGFIQFDDDDIVRDPFLIEIMKRYRD